MSRLTVLREDQLLAEAKECGLWARTRARELEYFLLRLPEIQAQAAGDPERMETLRRVFATYIANLEEQLARVRDLYHEWSRRYTWQA